MARSRANAAVGCGCLAIVAAWPISLAWSLIAWTPGPLIGTTCLGMAYMAWMLVYAADDREDL